MTETNDRPHRLTPDETDTLSRAVNASAASLDLPATETRILIALCERLAESIGHAERDSLEARSELARRLAPFDQQSRLPPETLRGWRFSAEAAIGLLKAGKADLDPIPMLECLLSSISEVERLAVELEQRDRVLAELEQRVIAIETKSSDHATLIAAWPGHAWTSDDGPIDAEPLVPEGHAWSSDDAPAVDTPAFEPEVVPSPDTRSTDETLPAGDPTPGDLDWEGPGPDDFVSQPAAD